MEDHGVPCPLLIDVYHKIVAEGLIWNAQTKAETTIMTNRTQPTLPEESIIRKVNETVYAVKFSVY